MSQETIQWLNNNILIGFGVVPWHFDESEQGEESNLYPGPVPIEDVKRRIFNWEPIKVPTFAQLGDLDDVPECIPIPRAQGCKPYALVRPDTKDVLGSVGEGYQPHGYTQWLIENVEAILDSGLAISSAGVLRRGALAWTAISLPHTLEIDSAKLKYRPQLVACTSLNGVCATTYRRSVILPVCDNTLAASLRDNTDTVRITHSSKSLTRINDVRNALGVIEQASQDFQDEVAALLDQKVTDRKFERWAQAFAGVAGKPKEEISALPAKKIDELVTLWRDDPRVNPWRHTGFGVLQAANTWTHHFQQVRGEGDDVARFERNQERVVRGHVVAEDRKALEVLAGVK
jgi:phage/plasmid-like protein (TIGR03299 family)